MDKFVVNPISGRTIKIGSVRHKMLVKMGYFNEETKAAKFKVNKSTSAGWENELTKYLDGLDEKPKQVVPKLASQVVASQVASSSSSSDESTSGDESISSDSD